MSKWLDNFQSAWEIGYKRGYKKVIDEILADLKKAWNTEDCRYCGYDQIVVDLIGKYEVMKNEIG